MPNNRAIRRGCPPPQPPRSTASSGVSRRELLTWLGRVGLGVVGFMASIKTLFTLTPPQRQDVEFSGGTRHRVDAGRVTWSVQTTQPTVTHVRAKAPAAAWV